MLSIKIWLPRLLGLCLLSTTSAVWAQPDLSGTYDVGTLTPLERPKMFGNNLTLTPEAAREIEQRAAKRLAQAANQSNPDRGAPEKGGRVGGYNAFWIDRGDSAVSVDGTFRTSIITYPENGQIPPMTERGAARRAGFLERWEIIWRSPDPTSRMNTGQAWWMESGHGPYDNMEQRPLAERCIIGSRSTAGPPMLPNLYNNHKRIIQTDTHVMILTEMNHDARVIRLDSEHRPAHVQTWLGDSIGYWEEDTLVVVTRNFTDTPPLSGADANLEVTERFRKLPNGDMYYRFSINNPQIWSEPWGGEYTWAKSDGKVYEYACHEGNYALGNIMRGARLLEQEYQAPAGRESMGGN